MARALQRFGFKRVRQKGSHAHFEHPDGRDEPYNELGGDYFIERQPKDAYQRRPVKQLERMGFDVALTPKAV